MPLTIPSAITKSVTVPRRARTPADNCRGVSAYRILPVCRCLGEAAVSPRESAANVYNKVSNGSQIATLTLIYSGG